MIESTVLDHCGRTDNYLRPSEWNEMCSDLPRKYVFRTITRLDFTTIANNIDAKIEANNHSLTISHSKARWPPIGPKPTESKGCKTSDRSRNSTCMEPAEVSFRRLQNRNFGNSRVYFRAFGELKSIRMGPKWTLNFISALQTPRNR